MSYWWESEPTERYWVEITDREDLGADLKCPQLNEAGKEYWSYSLINSIEPGDIVFHYSTRGKSFRGASVAGAPVGERPIVWAAHGTVGRSKPESRLPRPGWWRPLYGFTKSSKPLGIVQLQDPDEEQWIRDWIEEKKQSGTVAAPFQLYPGGIRGAQGYLAKMPREFVERWTQLNELSERLSDLEDALTDLSEVAAQGDPVGEISKQLPLNLKNESGYLAVIKGGSQRRSRNHERLVRIAAEWLQSQGATVSTPHPIDLRIHAPVEVLVEIKIARRSTIHAIREAVGQLLEYRYFLGPASADLCILLDRPPGNGLVEYVERELGMLLLWHENGCFRSGELTAERLGGSPAPVPAPRS